MENTNDTPVSSSKKIKWSIVLLYLFFFLLITYLSVQLWKSENNKNSLTQKLEKQLQDQEQKINLLNSTVNKQSGLLKEYKPYQAVIRSAALRDSIYKLLPYKFGDAVLVMPDSIKAIVNSVQINGNASEYSIKYLVRTSKGNYEAISISDLMKVE
jgi:outer membrane lipopolysaccharide assembly protein LptE/RlpB